MVIRCSFKAGITVVMLCFVLLSGCDLGGNSGNPTPQPTGHAGMGMDMGSKTPSATFDIKDDLQYIDMMVPHHQLAIDMAKLALEHAQHGELKGLARDIIQEQQDEINRMSIWRAEITGGTPAAGHGGMSDEHMKDMPGMNVDLKQLAASPNFDRDFIEAMIPHHQSAIDMSRAALPNLKHQPLHDLANDITTTQQLEIDRMRQWQEEWK